MDRGKNEDPQEQHDTAYKHNLDGKSELEFDTEETLLVILLFQAWTSVT